MRLRAIYTLGVSVGVGDIDVYMYYTEQAPCVCLFYSVRRRKVLVTNWKGESRKVAIGRLKVETRPMIMVEFEGRRTSHEIGKRTYVRASSWSAKRS